MRSVKHASLYCYSQATGAPFFLSKTLFLILKKYQKCLDSLALSSVLRQKDVYDLVVLTARLARNCTELKEFLLLSPDAYLNIYIKNNAEN